ncbi:MAG: hypothetical protein V2A66_08720 [Pseudomonadota bacterium]
MRKVAIAAYVVLFMMISGVAGAGIPPKIAASVTTNYPDADPHKGLDSAYFQPDPSKLRGYAVLLRGGIPAERARYFVGWDDYDYRGVVVHLGDGDKVTTRRGEIYTYLQPGTVMVVAGVKDFNGTIYFRLLSAEVYMPENRQGEKHHSRVTVMLGFKLPKELLAKDDAEGVLKVLGEWLKPFPDADSAKAYALSMIHSADKASGAKPKAPAVDAARPADAEKMKILEDKIEAEKKKMEEMEIEMRKMKEEKK